MKYVCMYVCVYVCMCVRVTHTLCTYICTHSKGGVPVPSHYWGIEAIIYL